jgi:microcompartment protein CcmK/EutM
VQLGRVIGTLVATKKHGKLEGAKLLLVQPLTLDDKPRGTAVLTIDSVGAGIGEKVLIVIEGRAAGEALRRRAAPVDAAIIGIVDRVTIDEEGSRGSFLENQSENEPRGLQTPKRPRGSNPRRS